MGCNESRESSKTKNVCFDVYTSESLINNPSYEFIELANFLKNQNNKKYTNDELFQLLYLFSIHRDKIKPNYKYGQSLFNNILFITNTIQLHIQNNGITLNTMKYIIKIMMYHIDEQIYDSIYNNQLYNLFKMFIKDKHTFIQLMNTNEYKPDEIEIYTDAHLYYDYKCGIYERYISPISVKQYLLYDYISYLITTNTLSENRDFVKKYVNMLYTQDTLDTFSIQIKILSLYVLIHFKMIKRGKKCKMYDLLYIYNNNIIKNILLKQLSSGSYNNIPNYSYENNYNKSCYSYRYEKDKNGFVLLGELYSKLMEYKNNKKKFIKEKVYKRKNKFVKRLTL